MTSQPQQEEITQFLDYAALELETRLVVQQRTTEIKSLMRRAAQDIIEIGQKLIEVKERLGHGNFQSWVNSEFEWSYQTAHRYMSVARNLGQISHSERFEARALYLLAAGDTSQEARLEALSRAEQGGFISYQAAQAIVNQYRLEEARIEPQAHELLMAAPHIVEQRDELQRLARLEPQRQVAVAERLASGQAASVQEARKDVERAERLAVATANLLTPEGVRTDGEVLGFTLEVNDNIAHIPDHSIDLVFTDPPYNISRNGGLTKLGHQLVEAEFDDEANPWDSAERDEYLPELNRWVEEWARVVRPGGSVVSFVDRVTVSYLWDMLASHGLKPKRLITWIKPNAAPVGLTRRNLISSSEAMVWAVKPGAPYTFNEVAGWDRRDFIVTNIISAQEKVDHRNQKPLAVLRPIIELLTNPGDLVLDNFGGSGSTAVAALELGRRVHLVEQNEDYIRLAFARINRSSSTAVAARQEKY